MFYFCILFDAITVFIAVFTITFIYLFLFFKLHRARPSQFPCKRVKRLPIIQILFTLTHKKGPQTKHCIPFCLS